jgi:hypothetical protein
MNIILPFPGCRLFLEGSISTYKTVLCHKQRDETVSTPYTGVEIWKFHSQIKTTEKIEQFFPG